MKSSMLIYGSSFTENTLSQKELEELHNALFGILLDVKKVCEDNSIKFFLCGGTALGAIRHKGFIPWDDDVDIMMLRSEYERFRTCFREAFPDKYLLAEPLDEDYTNKKPKIYLNKSVYKEVVYAGLPDRYNRVFIDIFPIENVPSSKIIRKINGALYDFAFIAASLAADYKYPSPVILNKCQEDSHLKKYYYTRLRLGEFFQMFFGMKFYLKLTERLSHVNKNTGWTGMPSARVYNRIIFPLSMFQESIMVDFNGVKFPVPKDYDNYLTHLYGNYMVLPKEEDRSIHSAAEFKLLEE